jgi:hypothetical protein
LGEVHSPYNIYKVVWGICPKCKKMYKIEYRGFLPIWKSMKCPSCLCIITPIALEKPTPIEDSCFNPSQRRIKIEQGKTY